MKTRLIGAIVAIVLATAGTLFLVNYLRGAEARAADGAELVPAYVVTTEVPPGTPAAALGDYLAVSQIPAMAAVPGRVTSLDDIEGLVSEVALMPGEQLIAARFVDPAEISNRGTVPLPEGMQAVTIALPVERAVGGAVQPGDTVGVVISGQAEAVADGREVLVTRQTFHKVLVLAVQPGTVFLPGDEETESSGGPVDALMVTLARTTPDIEVLVWGKEWGTIWLTLEPETADEAGGRAVTGDVVFP